MSVGLAIRYFGRALAARPLYGVVTVLVFAIALGANAADIGRMILTQGGRLIAVGLAVGVAGALALGGAALVASWLPARRAARTEPLVALRGE